MDIIKLVSCHFPCKYFQHVVTLLITVYFNFLQFDQKNVKIVWTFQDSLFLHFQGTLPKANHSPLAAAILHPNSPSSKMYIFASNRPNKIPWKIKSIDLIICNRLVLIFALNEWTLTKVEVKLSKDLPLLLIGKLNSVKKFASTDLSISNRIVLLPMFALNISFTQSQSQTLKDAICASNSQNYLL